MGVKEGLRVFIFVIREMEVHNWLIWCIKKMDRLGFKSWLFKSIKKMFPSITF